MPVSLCCSSQGTFRCPLTPGTAARAAAPPPDDGILGVQRRHNLGSCGPNLEGTQLRLVRRGSVGGDRLDPPDVRARRERTDVHLEVRDGGIDERRRERGVRGDLDVVRRGAGHRVPLQRRLGRVQDRAIFREQHRHGGTGLGAPGEADDGG